ncbi:hypothetical protein KIV56_00915 [Cryobacterium breve]|uniref:Uncharacterized protein n=1 Tax=Cryobacterium breve TaxID=1259258 RepID=A0ABY7NEH9_9MICO|nr:hypothetical protein [Cryobacterium breve]WBM80182.1 hypothetical protein KIV56_00915 [Cryobacterium breve]
MEGEEALKSRWETDPFIDVDRDGDPIYQIYVWLEIASEYFSCNNCRLVLDGADFINLTELPQSFEVEGSDDDIEFESEYGND